MAPDLGAVAADWRRWLTHEKRVSPHTQQAYETDLFAFSGFLVRHLGGVPGVDDLRDLQPADFRAWLAWRAGKDLSRSSTARALSVVRGFFRWCERNDRFTNHAIRSVRSPKLPHQLPKPLRADDALEAVQRVSDRASEIRNPHP